jgi:hypothetical protein
MIENIVVVEQTTQGRDDIFTRNSVGENSSEGDLCDWGNLPPCLARSPYACSIRLYHRHT